MGHIFAHFHTLHTVYEAHPVPVEEACGHERIINSIKLK